MPDTTAQSAPQRIVTFVSATPRLLALDKCLERPQVPVNSEFGPRLEEIVALLSLIHTQDSFPCLWAHDSDLSAVAFAALNNKADHLPKLLLAWGSASILHTTLLGTVVATRAATLPVICL